MNETRPAAPAQDGFVPGWLVRLAAVGWRLLATLALILAIVAILSIISTVTVSILVAAIVAATFAPFVLALRDRGWSRVKAAAAVFLGAALVIIATIVVIVVAFIPYLDQIIGAIQTGTDALQGQFADADLPPEIAAVAALATNGLESWVSTDVSGVVNKVAELATIGVLATFLTFFFMMDGDKAWLWVLSSTNAWRRDAITSSGDVALARVGGYLRGTAVLAGVAGLVEGLLMLVIGVPLAGPLAVVVFFGRFIPYLGGLVTTILVGIVALGALGVGPAVLLVVLIGVLNVILGKFLAPFVYQRTVDMHPAVVLIALPAGAAVAGVVGLFAVVPLVAFVLAIAGSVVEILGVESDKEATAGELVPVWLDRLGQWSWRLLIVIALLGVVVLAAIQIPVVVVPVILGIVLAATLAPFAGYLERRGWSHGRAALGATLGLVVGVVVIVGLTVISLIGPAEEMIDQAVAGAQSSNTAAGGQLQPVVEFVEHIGDGAIGTIGAALASLAGLALVALLSTLLTYYFMRDGGRFWHGFLGRIEPARRSRIEVAGSRAFSVLGGYMVGTGAISIFGAATQWLIMTILGIPFALPLAILAVFGGFIPYIGSMITTGLAFLVTVATGTPTDVAIMAVFTIVFNIVQGNFVAPLVYSRVVSLHPAVVLAAIPAGSEVAGVVGMFLVVPFLGVVAAVWRTVLMVLDTGPIQPAPTTGPETAKADPAVQVIAPG
jgi:putative heme transporter